jgi:hypothetical protein
MASATVTALESITANILATSLCTMSVPEALRFVETLPQVECLLVDNQGSVHTSRGFLWTPTLPRVPNQRVASNLADPWPANFEVKLAVELPTIEGARRYRRPYVAIWVEDDKGNAVRTLSVWGNSNRYLKDLSDWWKFAKDDKDMVKAVTRATRGPGKYDLVWDGKDDKGNAVGQGTYTIKIEVHREFGRHLRQTGKIECKSEATSVKLEKNDELAETKVEYQKKK